LHPLDQVKLPFQEKKNKKKKIKTKLWDGGDKGE
jgi:hypothetical protein